MDKHTYGGVPAVPSTDIPAAGPPAQSTSVQDRLLRTTHTQTNPTGTACSIWERISRRESGKSANNYGVSTKLPVLRPAHRPAAVSVVCTAFMPQPMSTPTAAGIIAPTVLITVPTVAPLPTCAASPDKHSCLSYQVVSPVCLSLGLFGLTYRRAS